MLCFTQKTRALVRADGECIGVVNEMPRLVRLRPGLLWIRVREGSSGIEIFSAVTLLLLALAKVFDPAPTGSVVVLLLSLQFPGLWLSLVFILGVVHLYALMEYSVMPWIAVRKVCSSVGLAVYVGIIADVLTVRPNVGALIWLGLIVMFLIVAILRRIYTVLGDA